MGPWQEIYGELGRYEESIRAYTRALEIDPKEPPFFYYGRAMARFHKSEYDKAWADVHKAESLGLTIDAEFLADLREASGRDE